MQRAGRVVVLTNSNSNYPSHSVRDRIRFLVFTSWWTFVTAALYIAAFAADILAVITSIAVYGAWLFVT